MICGNVDRLYFKSTEGGIRYGSRRVNDSSGQQGSIMSGSSAAESTSYVSLYLLLTIARHSVNTFFYLMFPRGEIFPISIRLKILLW